MVEKIKVKVGIEARCSIACEVEMTRAEYDEWCEKIDSARGYKAEQVAEELIEMAGADLMRDLEVDDMCVEDFDILPEHSTTQEPTDHE